jgi:hypothetical protein
MKKVSQLLFTALISISILSCSKGDYNSLDKQEGYNRFKEENQPKKSGFLTADKTHGNKFKSNPNGVSAVYNKLNNSLVVTAIADTGNFVESIILNMEFDSFSPEIYLNQTNFSTAYFDYGNGGSKEEAISGKITIHEITEFKVRGAFEFTTRTMHISNGLFDAPIVK